MFAGLVGVYQGYVLFESMPDIVSLCLIFLVPIYFGLIMSNTLHPPYLLSFVLGCLLGAPMYLLTPEWGLVLSGTIAGTMAFLVRNLLKVFMKSKESNG